jgi:DNA-binding XRE family transcriptional regulator
MLRTVTIYGSNGSNRSIQHPRQEVVALNALPCRIYTLEVNTSTEPVSESFSEFDRLVTSIEENDGSAAELSNARKWVASQFYREAATLASLRLAAGLSQKQLGDICSLTQSHVSRYESGKHEPALTLSKQMADAVGVSLDTYCAAWRNTQAQLQENIQQ